MTDSNGKISTMILEATTDLGNNLSQSEVLLRFKNAELRLQKDEKAQILLTELSELQQKTRASQFSGIISESDLKRLRELQNSFTDNESIQEYQISSELAIGFLRDLNQEISQLLGVDFAALTRRSGGTC